ncbi:lymphotactin-like [Triplophysa dalaica]|uniref:lymphotactin-like n=1 Tax=Triplophysa dalaica TaxID=1582913 RepID=UPI0024DF6B6D|nr:lymphotactin-like [Triplophysa dalaica]
MKLILLTFVLYHIRLTSVEARDDKPIEHCCLQVFNTRVQIGDILDYDIQNSPPCPIRAIQFHTKKGKTVCWDPDEKWAKRASQAIDVRTTTKPTIGPPKCMTSISSRIPSTAIKTPGPETVTSTELPVQDYKQNFKRNSTEKTNKELFTTRTEPREHTKHRSQITETFHMNELHMVDKKQERRSKNTPMIINDLNENKYTYTKIHNFCLKEQDKYSKFCIKQP